MNPSAAGARPASCGDVRLASSGSTLTAEASLASIDEGAAWAQKLFAAHDEDADKAHRESTSCPFGDSKQIQQANDTLKNPYMPVLQNSMQELQEGATEQLADDTSHGDSYGGSAPVEAAVRIPNAVSDQDCMHDSHKASVPGEFLSQYGATDSFEEAADSGTTAHHGEPIGPVSPRQRGMSEVLTLNSDGSQALWKVSEEVHTAGGRSEGNNVGEMVFVAAVDPYQSALEGGRDEGAHVIFCQEDDHLQCSAHIFFFLNRSFDMMPTFLCRRLAY